MVVLIPVFNRPEFLQVCLEYIQAAEGWKQFEYWFLCDFGYKRSNLSVIKEFPGNKRIIERQKHKFKAITKQSFNLLDGYREAVESGATKVFLIEDDVFVANDFFKWHLSAQEHGPLTIATDNHNTKFEVSNDLTKIYTGANEDYQSLGVCWNARYLKSIVLPHANKDYYRDPVGYCFKNFTQSKIGRFFVEQDGLIRRAISNKLNAIFPHVPRAYHAGFIGYNRRGKMPEGRTIKDRAKRVKEITTNPDLMRRYVQKLEHFEDSKPVNLIGNKWSELCA